MSALGETFYTEKKYIKFIFKWVVHLYTQERMYTYSQKRTKYSFVYFIPHSVSLPTLERCSVKKVYMYTCIKFLDAVSNILKDYFRRKCLGKRIFLGQFCNSIILINAPKRLAKTNLTSMPKINCKLTLFTF